MHACTIMISYFSLKLSKSSGFFNFFTGSRTWGAASHLSMNCVDNRIEDEQVDQNDTHC